LTLEDVLHPEVGESDDERRVELIGYDRMPRRYKRIKPDKRGWIWLAPVRLWLGLTRERLTGIVRLACFDPDTSQELGDYTAISQELAESEHRRVEAEARAEAEATARAEADKRSRSTEAELKQARRRKS
jgi:hypothetical protein